MITQFYNVISQKFMDDHICLYRGSPPSNLKAFCKHFRKGQEIYQVMLLNTKDIKKLRELYITKRTSKGIPSSSMEGVWHVTLGA